jgi:hypothetical protein
LLLLTLVAAVFKTFSRRRLKHSSFTGPLVLFDCATTLLAIQLRGYTVNDGHVDCGGDSVIDTSFTKHASIIMDGVSDSNITQFVGVNLDRFTFQGTLRIDFGRDLVYFDTNLDLRGQIPIVVVACRVVRWETPELSVGQLPQVVTVTSLDIGALGFRVNFWGNGVVKD